MKLIIKEDYLKTLENILINIDNALLKPVNDVFYIKIKEKKVLIYIKNDFSICKLNFENDQKIAGIKDGEITLGIKTFISLLSNCEKLDLVMEQKDCLYIKNGKFKCSINKKQSFFKLKEGEFKTEGYEKIDFQFQYLKTINKRFKDFCLPISQFQNNEELMIRNCIKIKKSPDNPKILSCSTDNYRFIIASFEDENIQNFEFHLFPYVLNLISNLFNNVEIVHIFFNQEYLIIKNEEFEFKTKNIHGNFPCLFQWIDVKPNIKFLIEKSQLIGAINRSSLFMTSKTKFLTFTIGKNFLKLEREGGDKGSSTEEIEIIHKLSDTDINFQLDGILLKRLLKNIEDEILEFKLMKNTSPIVIHGVQERDFKHFILPTRV